VARFDLTVTVLPDALGQTLTGQAELEVTEGALAGTLVRVEAAVPVEVGTPTPYPPELVAQATGIALTREARSTLKAATSQAEATARAMANEARATEKAATNQAKATEAAFTPTPTTEPTEIITSTPEQVVQEGQKEGEGKNIETPAQAEKEVPASSNCLSGILVIGLMGLVIVKRNA
jgi:cobalamin biosynthesis Mg chelatase CobN